MRLPSDPRDMVDRLGHGLEELKDWLWVNKLKLNPNKMEVLLAGPNSVLGSG